MFCICGLNNVGNTGFCCPCKELWNCQIYLSLPATEVNRLRVDKRLWGNTANSKWLRIYSTPFDIVLTREKGGERHSIQRQNIYLSKKQLQVLRSCFGRHGWTSVWPMTGSGGWIFALVAHTAFTFLIYLSFSWFMRLFTFVLFFSPFFRKREWGRGWVDVWMLSGASHHSTRTRLGTCVAIPDMLRCRCIPINFRYEF